MRAWVAFAAGMGGGALVGVILWWYAGRKLDQAFVTGEAQLADRLGVGTAQLQQRFAAGRQELRTQITREVDAALPGAVRYNVAQAFANYGITPETGRQVATILNYADRIGVI